MFISVFFWDFSSFYIFHYSDKESDPQKTEKEKAGKEERVVRKEKMVMKQTTKAKKVGFT